MALLTKTAMSGILRNMLEVTDMNEDIETNVQRLQADFDERENYLRNYGEVYDGEDTEEYEFVGKEITEVDNTERDTYKKKYEEMRQKYLDRFFGGVDPKEIEQIETENKEDLKDHEEPQTFEELLTKSENEGE